jgi:hypothetical protein
MLINQALFEFVAGDRSQLDYLKQEIHQIFSGYHRGKLSGVATVVRRDCQTAPHQRNDQAVKRRQAVLDCHRHRQIKQGG